MNVARLNLYVAELNMVDIDWPYRYMINHFSREPWRPGGSLHSSATRQPRSKSAERTRSLSRSRSQDRSRSKSPRSRSGRHVVISDVDQELIR